MIPDPLHPAIVHFPIVLIILGTLAVIASVFIRYKPLLYLASGLLVLSAISAYFAEQTGSDAYQLFKDTFPNAENILNTHAENATWTVRFAYATAALSLITIFLRNNKAKRLCHILTVVSAMTLTFYMHKTAWLGGEMVYGEALGLSKGGISDTLEKSEHSHEGPDAHAH